MSHDEQRYIAKCVEDDIGFLARGNTFWLTSKPTGNSNRPLFGKQRRRNPVVIAKDTNPRVVLAGMDTDAPRAEISMSSPTECARSGWVRCWVFTAGTMVLAAGVMSAETFVSAGDRIEGVTARVTFPRVSTS